MPRSFRAGGKDYYVGIWRCKFEPRERCGCCMPKNMIPPSSANHPSIREFVTPIERGKSLSPIRPRRAGAYDGAVKSK